MTNSVDIIKRLLLNDQDCPFSKTELHVNVQELIKIASLNKCLHVVFHFIECKECKEYINDKDTHRLIQLKLLVDVQQELLLQEQKKLIEISRLNNLRIVFYKHNPCQKLFKTQKISSDIDVLVTRQTQQKLCVLYKKQKYKQKIWPPKEISLFSKKSPISIDLHTLVAYPHHGTLTTARKLMIRRISAEIYMNFHSHTTNIVTGPYYLVFLSLYFWYNDLGFGLSTLYTFLKIIQFSADTDLDQVVQITRKYKCYTLFSFIVALSFQFFNVEISDKVIHRFQIGLKHRSILPLFLKRFIVNKYFIDDWNSENTTVSGIRTDFYLADMILNDTVSPIRLVRPRVCFLYIRSLLLPTGSL